MLARKFQSIIRSETKDDLRSQANTDLSGSGRNYSAGRRASSLWPAALNRLTILLVEDNETNQILTQTTLQRAGCNVMIARNGQEAIDACRIQAFDIILMDIEMPQINGIEATQFIRTQAGPNQTSTIIALTAYGSASEKYIYQHSGADYVITKPFTMEALAPALETQFGISIPDEPPRRTELPNQSTVIDPAILSRIACEHDLADIEYILRSFWRVAEGLFTDIQTAQRTDNIHELRHSAHALKGAAANIGLREIAYHAAKIGSAPQAKKASIVVDIERSMQRARKALSVFVEAMR